MDIKNFSVALSMALIGAMPAFAQTPADDHSAHAMLTQAAQPATPSFQVPTNEKLPPGADRATATLAASKLKSEYVHVSYAGGPPIKTWIAYPQAGTKAPVVMVIHEIFGLTDWVRGIAEQLAEDGYIAVAPDLLSGMGPGGGGTAEIGGDDAARKVIANLAPSEALNRLNAVRAHALKLPMANGHTATIGYCWGGARSFEYAAFQPDLNAAIVFYGTSPAATELAKINAPVLGLYGADDARVNATIEPASAEMKKLGKTYEYEIYEGAGHGFLRAQADRGGANYRASEQAWPRVLAFLARHTKENN